MSELMTPSKLQDFIDQCAVAEKNPETFVDFEGRRFRAPWRCLCCGKETGLAQFCYGRLCPPCDVGACHPLNRAYRLSAAHEKLPRDWYFSISEEVDARSLKEPKEL